MMKFTLVTVLFCITFAIAVFWLQRPPVVNEPRAVTEPNRPVAASTPVTSSSPIEQNEADEEPWFAQVKALISEALIDAQYADAVAQFEAAYAQASTQQNDQLTALFLEQGAALLGSGEPKKAITLLNLFSQNNEDRIALRLLATAYHQTKQWEAMLETVRRGNRLEYEASYYDDNIARLTKAAGKLSTQFQRDGDPLAILALYQSLYNEYPQIPRFQFDLAQAHLALGSSNEAKSLLELVRYDPTLGDLAERQLSLIQETNAEQVAAGTQHQSAQEPPKQKLVVPLIRAGSSLLVNATIDGGASTLLLDTGASITSLSREQIERLGLRPLNRSIQLSTANGKTEARLFRAETLNLGQVAVKNLMVAEIDLGQSRIDGLLGTDVFRRMSARFNYLIDDQRNALIFEAK